MKLGVFSDPHYSSKEITCGVRYNSKSLEKIKDAYKFFEKEKCDLVVCLGDLVDTEPTEEKEISNLNEIGKVIKNSGVLTVCMMGNHDAFTLTEKEFYGTLGLDAPKDLVFGDLHLLFLDACYFKSGKHYAPKDDDWTDTYYPFEELLESKLKKINGEAYIFIHQNIDPAVDGEHRLFNADKIFKIINDSKVVKTVFQGHYHAGYSSEYDGVKYLTLPAMCQNDSAYFIFEL